MVESAKQPKVVLVGGGHGPSALRKGLQRYTDQITSIVTVMDSGGSSGKLREYQVPAVGDFTAAMADQAISPIDGSILRHRFTNGHQKDHRVSNILFVSVYETFCKENPDRDNILEASLYIMKKFPVVGKIYMVSHEVDLHLKSETSSNKKLDQEHQMDELDENGQIVKVELNRDAHISKQAEEAFLDADLIIFGPGSIHGSIEGQLKILGVCDAIRRSRAFKVMMSNIANTKGQTNGFTVADYARIITNNLGFMLDATIYYQDQEEIDSVTAESYHKWGQDLVKLTEEAYVFSRAVLCYDLVRVEPHERGFPLLRHDEVKSAEAVMETWRELKALGPSFSRTFSNGVRVKEVPV